MIIEILFWTVATLLFYTYFGYPILLFLLAKIVHRSFVVDETYEPTVSVLIACYNEKDYIEAKLNNTLELNYPKEKLEIIVFSDASDDGSDDVVRKYKEKGVKLVRVEGRQGKTICQNESIKKATGEIVIFSDMKPKYNKDAIRKIVRNFADERVISVLGKLVYKNDEGQIKEGAYWRLEQWIKNAESKLYGSISGTGAIYSIRRGQYVPLPNYAQSDFTEPIAVKLKHGGMVVSDPEAVAYNVSAGSSTKEFKRHERIITRFLFTKKIVKDAFNPLKSGPYAFFLISHKSLRFYAPFLMLVALGLNTYLSLDSFFWQIILALHVGIYLLAVIGYVLDRNNKGFFAFSIPYHFMVLNAAALKAWYNYLRGRNFVTWKLKGSN